MLLPIPAQAWYNTRSEVTCFESEHGLTCMHIEQKTVCSDPEHCTVTYDFRSSLITELEKKEPSEFVPSKGF